MTPAPRTRTIALQNRSPSPRRGSRRIVAGPGPNSWSNTSSLGQTPHQLCRTSPRSDISWPSPAAHSIAKRNGLEPVTSAVQKGGSPVGSRPPLHAGSVAWPAARPYDEPITVATQGVLMWAWGNRLQGADNGDIPGGARRLVRRLGLEENAAAAARAGTSCSRRPIPAWASARICAPEIDLETHIADLLGVLEVEDLRDVMLVGHSYGGMVATGVADRARDRIAHLVYLDAFAPQDGESAFDLHGPNASSAMRGAPQDAGEGWRFRRTRCRPTRPRPTSPGRPGAGCRSRSRPSSNRCA